MCIFPATMTSNQTGVDVGMSSTSNDQPKELCSSGDEHIPKVVRESASNGTGSTSTEPIEIPPPRPKRKPLHPYPRKLVTSSSKELLALKKPEMSLSPTKLTSEAQTGSPTSVLSPIDSDAMGSNTPKHCGSLDSYVSKSCVTGLFHNEQESIFHPYTPSAEEENGSPSSGTNSAVLITDNKSDVELEDTSVDAPITSLKLFGKSVVITEISRTSSPVTTHDLKSFRLNDGDGYKVGTKKDEQTSTPESTENVSVSMTEQGSSVSCQVPWNSWSCVAPPILCCLPTKQENKNESSTTIAAPLPWWPFFGGLTFPLNSCFNEHLRESGKNTISLDSKVHHLDYNGPKTEINSKSSPEKQVRGFVPYQRCSSGKEDYQTDVSEDENSRRIRTCL